MPTVISSPVSALAEFKRLLVPGARFLVLFEPLTIRGNLTTTNLAGGAGTREVETVNSKAVQFLTEMGGRTSFQFPPAAEIQSEQPGDFSWRPNGKKTLTYRFVS